MPFKTI